MLPADPYRLTLAQASALIARRALWPAQYAAALIQRRQAVDGQLHTVVRQHPAAQPVDAVTRDRVRNALHGAGIALDGEAVDQLAQCAPAIDAMAARLRRDADWDCAPATAFAGPPRRQT